MAGRECKRSRVKVTQFPETDALFVELAKGEVAETRQIGDNLIADLNAESEPMSLTMELVGIAPEDKPGDSPIEKDPRFLERIRQARESLKKGNGVHFEDAELQDPANDRTLHRSTRA